MIAGKWSSALEVLEERSEPATRKRQHSGAPCRYGVDISNAISTQMLIGFHSRIARAAGIRARRKRRFVRTTTPDPALPVAPNVLERDFQAHLPNRVWSTEITYVPTREGWLYLAIVEDRFSRRIVGWATAASLERALPLQALAMALALRVPHAATVDERGYFPAILAMAKLSRAPAATLFPGVHRPTKRCRPARAVEALSRTLVRSTDVN